MRFYLWFSAGLVDGLVWRVRVHADVSVVLVVLGAREGLGPGFDAGLQAARQLGFNLRMKS